MKHFSYKTLILLSFLVLTADLAGAPAFRKFPRDPKIKPNPEWLRYYKETYEENRAEFLRKADSLGKVYPGCVPFNVKVPTATNAELFVDGLYIPALNGNRNLLILTSGVHGVEGFAGSAIQRMVIDKQINVKNLDQTGILLIHAVNPYGFNFIRRVSENNVDLNRNSDVTEDLFSTKNEGYTALYRFINPDKPVNLGSCQNRFFVLTAITKIIKASMPVLRQAVLQGQYEHPEGLYYGGNKFEPQLADLKPIMVKYAGQYGRIVQIDLHTGYGERGKMHLFPNPPKSPEVKNETLQLFPGYQIDWGDSKDFYVINGDFSALIGKILPQKMMVPMLLEYGTLNSQKTMGSLRSIHFTILENQGFHHGYKNKRSERKVKEWFREMYAPMSPVWRTQVMDQSEKLMNVLFTELGKMS